MPRFLLLMQSKENNSWYFSFYSSAFGKYEFAVQCALCPPEWCRMVGLRFVSLGGMGW